jgi:hypothetical protein
MNAQNAVVVCRDCDLLRFKQPPKGALEQPKMLNVWLSHDLHGRVMDTLAVEFGGLTSLAALARYLVDRFLKHPENFDDLSSRQDQGMGVKVNFWVSKGTREALKEQASALKLTVADVIKGLFLLYLEQVDAVSVK